MMTDNTEIFHAEVEDISSTVHFSKKTKDNDKFKNKLGKRSKSDPSQPKLSSFFTKISEKRKLSDIPTANKKPKTKEEVESSEVKGEESEKSEVCEDVRKTKKCSDCRQFFNEISLYPGDANDAVEEFIMLTDPKLSVHLEGSFEDSDINERPQHKITNFCVYDAHMHICPFDTGLIEKNVSIYFSGCVKPIYSDDPGMEGGVLTKNMGPIIEWFVCGFDGGENALVGFGTAFAEYILMNPSDLYLPFMEAVQEKTHLSKTVIEFVTENEDATYEDLLNKVCNTVLPSGLKSLNEESLLRHAQFVIDQVQSLDAAAADFDKILIVLPSIRSLIDLSGVVVGGKRVSSSKRIKRGLKKVKVTHSFATTTPLVCSTFENFFPDQLEKSSDHPSKRTRCGMCEFCQQVDCGKCSHCLNMVKFGGPGTLKQACIKRRCPYLAIKEAEEDDILNDKDGDIMDKKACSFKTDHKIKKSKKSTKLKTKKKVNIEWIGKPVIKNKRRYYDEVFVNKWYVCCGDYVLLKPADSNILRVAKVIRMWETLTGEQLFHALLFHHGSDTVLGETALSAEIFGSYKCKDVSLFAIHDKCNVSFKSPPKDWAFLGGHEDLFDLSKYGDKSFFYQKWYDSQKCRFEDPPLVETDDKSDLKCTGCKAKKERKKMNFVTLNEANESDGVINYKSAKWRGQLLCPGDCIFINPEAYSFPCKQPAATKKKSLSQKTDETLYPEIYRKNDDAKRFNFDIQEPFKIGYILKIYMKQGKKLKPKIKVKIFYRPEDTHRKEDFTSQQDLNLLYWSDEEAIINFPDIEGKCFVIYGDNMNESVEEFSKKGLHRFYFYEAYDSFKKLFDDPPDIAQRLGSAAKGKGKKLKTPAVESCFNNNNPVISKKLRTLDVFAGCGGLSQGFHQAGISDTLWAIENETAAAQAFRLNFPNCAVFHEDCNVLLKLVLEGEEKTYKGQKLPQKGEVDLLCGGPPCQGFSGMNRFNSRQYSLFKNSLVVSYLSYCDYYRPKFFLLENVRNFVSFKKSMILKLALSCLIRMGYQCTFGVLQAGSYGIPQTRRRAIILAAAPGQKLPMFPEPQHVFSSRLCQLSVVVDDKKFDSNIRWNYSAPYRTITVRDAMSDLPPIRNGAKTEEVAYTEPKSHYQKKMRGLISYSLVRDHVCKEMNPLVEARMQHIPTKPASDWRDLPNIIVRLSDGTYTKKLIYTHKDKKNGNAKNGAFRGVCQCATGKACDPLDRQFNTLIPWCLPHTGNRHNNWAGLYGRLDWDGFFSTTITNPEPMGKQGRVLHPEQHRVVSVRECARSQGFPDSYRFCGTILDKHRQIGNAVPPPLSEAIALEIKKSVIALEK